MNDLLYIFGVECMLPAYFHVTDELKQRHGMRGFSLVHIATFNICMTEIMSACYEILLYTVIVK